jgi:hypothetical protein
LQYSICLDAEKQKTEKILQNIKLATAEFLILRVDVTRNAQCKFSYSIDGKNFIVFDQPFQAKPGKWVGAKLGTYCTRAVKFNDGAYTDLDYFKISSK